LIGASSENNLDINIEIVDIEDKIEFVSLKLSINAHIVKYIVLIWQYILQDFIISNCHMYY